MPAILLAIFLGRLDQKKSQNLSMDLNTATLVPLGFCFVVIAKSVCHTNSSSISFCKS